MATHTTHMTQKTACTACRKHKARCSGVAPCQRCQRHQSLCWVPPRRKPGPKSGPRPRERTTTALHSSSNSSSSTLLLAHAQSEDEEPVWRGHDAPDGTPAVVSRNAAPAAHAAEPPHDGGGGSGSGMRAPLKRTCATAFGHDGARAHDGDEPLLTAAGAPAPPAVAATPLDPPQLRRFLDDLPVGVILVEHPLAARERGSDGGGAWPPVAGDGDTMVDQVPARGALWVNEGACALLGYERKELLELLGDDGLGLCLRLVHPDDAASAAWQYVTAAAGAEPTCARRRYVRKGGATAVLCETQQVTTLRRANAGEGAATERVLQRTIVLQDAL